MYDELQATLQDVKKCASTAVQLVTTKPKTRYSNVDVRDVKEFLSQVEGLPCKLPDTHGVDFIENTLSRNSGNIINFLLITYAAMPSLLQAYM